VLFSPTTSLFFSVELTPTLFRAVPPLLRLLSGLLHLGEPAFQRPNWFFRLFSLASLKPGGHSVPCIEPPRFRPCSNPRPSGCPPFRAPALQVCTIHGLAFFNKKRGRPLGTFADSCPAPGFCSSGVPRCIPVPLPWWVLLWPCVPVFSPLFGRPYHVFYQPALFFFLIFCKAFPFLVFWL